MNFFNKVTAHLFLLTLAISASGCSSNFTDAINSALEARTINKGLPITAEYVNSLPYASAIVKLNDRAPILIILSSAEYINSKYSYSLTWLSSDKAAIVTENGRIVKTIGLTGNNLEQLFTQNHNGPPTPGTSKSWHAIYDWSPGYRYNFTADIQSKTHGSEQISTELWTEQTEHTSEIVFFESLNTSFTNHFWKVPQQGSYKSYIIKTTQYIGPNMDKIEMLFIKPFLEPISATENREATQ
ncbi:YjbF family lipoprotein [Marinomonas sp. C2222]|uniref:YjbF family lipoprotein n=1 Tax=Marinomonas sargassi TaxID=2984494 RepID=A0ABT2YP48_9GAMM|nr:YjbF family lipoprotein [Marinomonas sargassi]MCV2401655.1 YjbF family lipoprotein [Marinomonas sargassi]